MADSYRNLPPLTREPIEIRPFDPCDEPQVVALWSAVFGYQQPHNEPHRVIERKQAVADRLFFVAVEREQIVGTVMGGYDGHRGWIYSLAVSAEKRRQGIGSALMRFVEGELAARLCPKINLQVVANNASVVAFYQLLGYAVEERISLGKVLTTDNCSRGL